MKLRFERDALRYRMRKSDLEQLNHQGFVTNTVTFPSGMLQYELHIADVPETTADINGGIISVQIPVGIATEWINTEEVGIYHRMHLANDQILDITIEKDFPCKDTPEEDKSDTFTELAAGSGKNEVC